MINYTFSSKPVKTFEGRTFHSILENDIKVVGYSEIIREIPPIMYFQGDAIIFKEAILTKGEIFGGIVRGGEIAGAKIAGGEINGGILYFGEFINGIFNSGKLLGGTIYNGEFNGADIRGGKFYGGIYNNGVKIYDGIYHSGIYNETPYQIQTPEIFWYIESDLKILYIGCDSGSLATFNMENFKQKHELHSDQYNDPIKNNIYMEEYSTIVNIIKNRYL